ncbi:MAG: GNAT family N-acetyltransferase [Cellulomonadaceae bacterium]|nr:GNAT family N-acetyltransferase [Cellulomonadaceae bacterium]
MTYHRAPTAQVDPLVLYRLLRLRVQVFVVEQHCAYEDLDGRDVEPGTELLWATDGDEVLSTVRVLHDATALRIGRVATAPAARSRGVAGELMRRAVERCTELDPTADIVLGAQAHLAPWYARFGFAVDGEPYDEDAIPHLPMRRPAESRQQGHSA